MKKLKRTYTRCALTASLVLLVLLVAGSIWDLPISKFLYPGHESSLGQFFAAFGELPAFSLLAGCGEKDVSVSVTLVNRSGRDISSISITPSTSSDWDTEFVDGMFHDGESIESGLGTYKESEVPSAYNILVYNDENYILYDTSVDELDFAIQDGDYIIFLPPEGEVPIEIAHDYDPSDYDEADETAYVSEETEPTLSGDLSGYTGCWKLADEPFYFVINEDFEWIAINLYGEQVGPGYVVDEAGIDVALLKDVKEVRRGRVSDYAAERPGATFVSDGSIWDVPCDVALPCATQNELPLSGVQSLIKNGVQLVAEGANMPTTPEAIEALQAAGVAYAPGKASNAGGVATSGLEMQQNSGRTQWPFEQTDAKLHQIMVDIHANAVSTADEFGVPGDYVAGANLAGFRKVADAMVAMGLI